MAIPRPLLIGAGAVLIAVSPVVGILPGPGGVFVFAAGLVLLLRGSARARRGWVRLKRRWPRLGDYADRGMRRGSAMRRHALARAARLD